MTMKISLLKYALILPLLLAAACAQDTGSPQSPEPASAKFRISAAAADPGTPEDPVADNEKINSYRIIFVNNQTVDGSNVRIVRAVVPKDLLQAVEEDTFTVDLAPGTYDIYAIANISTKPEDSNAPNYFTHVKDKNGRDNVSKFLISEIGAMAPEHDDIQKAYWDVMPNGYTGDIPMCGFIKGAEVTGKIEESFSVEVVRMLAKMEFQFSAPDATVPVTIKKVTVHDVSTGAIPFMPNYDILGTSASTLLDGKTGREDLIFDESTISGKFPITVGEDWTTTGTRYLRESVAEVHPSKSFLISVEMLRGNTDGEKDKEWQDVVQYAIADELQYINRNDHIIIPIEIKDWILDIDVHFYPPIGGYPAVVTEKTNKEFYISFGTQGAFEISAKVRNAKPGSLPLSKDKYTIEVGAPIIEDGSRELFVEGKEPKEDPTTGEILGEVSSEKGKARVPLTVKVNDNGTETTYSRNIYIIRK